MKDCDIVFNPEFERDQESIEDAETDAALLDSLAEEAGSTAEEKEAIRAWLKFALQ